MKIGIAALAGLLALVCGMPAAAQTGPTRAQMDAACQPGTDPQPAGNEAYAGGLHSYQRELTPTHLAGATTVSAEEAKCLIDTFGEAIVILSGYDGTPSLPGALNASRASSPEPDVQPQFVAALTEITGGDTRRPLLTYCHHEECFLSYNVALRAVQAGYSNVFWLRTGILGWKAAGYAYMESTVEASVESPPPARQGISDGYRGAVLRCADFALIGAEDVAEIMTGAPTEPEQNAALAERMRTHVETWNNCFDQTVPQAAETADDRKDAATGRANGAAGIEKAFADARAEVEENPAHYLSITYSNLQPPALRQVLTQIRAAQTLDQACGTFDYTQPDVYDPGDSVEQMQARWKIYRPCVETYMDQYSATWSATLEAANVWLKATRRFTCAESRNPQCIPSQPYTDIAGVATDSNVAFAKERFEFFMSERRKAYEALLRLNEWTDTLNARIDEYNASQ